MTRLARQINRAAKASYNPVDECQPEAAPRGLGAEKRIEHPGLNFWRHTAARVGDLELDVFAPCQGL